MDFLMQNVGNEQVICKILRMLEMNNLSFSYRKCLKNGNSRYFLSIIL